MEKMTLEEAVAQVTFDSNKEYNIDNCDLDEIMENMTNAELDAVWDLI